MPDPDAVPAVAPGGSPPPLGSPVVDWITDGTRRDPSVLSAVPPGYASYATVVIPDGDAAKATSDTALVEVLRAHTTVQPWQLGYLDTGVADVVAEMPRVAVYVGWPYVLVEAGPEQALGARRNADATPWHSALPELLFPRDCSWLVATRWDDDWRCVGGPAALVDALLRHPHVDARAVRPDEDMTPNGHDG